MNYKDFESNHSLKNRFILLMLMTNILIVLAILVPTYMTIRSYLIESTESYTSSLVNEQINMLEQDFIKTSNMVNVISTWIASEFELEKGLEDMDYMLDFKNMLSQQFQSFLGENKFNTSLYIYFNYEMFGKEYSIWYNETDDNNYELQDDLGHDYFNEYYAWYNEPIDNHIALWTKPYTALNGPYAGNQLSSYVSPVMIDDQAVAVVGVDLYVDEIIEALKEIDLYKTGYVYVLQADGNVLYHPSLAVDAAFDNSESRKGLLDAFNKNQSGILSYINDENEKIYTAYGHLDNGWLVATHVPEKEVFTQLRDLINVLVISILFILLLILIITNLLVIRIFRPIARLTEEMSIIDGGHLKHSISNDLLNDQTEIGILANEVDNMRLRLLESFNRIEKYNDKLEHIVEERTLELQEALKQVQLNHHAVIELERNKGMSVLMKNLAHRLNTPLGTSITMTSYLKNLLQNDDLDMKEINEIMTLIESSQKRVKDVINQLGYILEPDKKTEYVMIDIEKLFVKAQTSLTSYKSHALNIKYDNQVKHRHLVSQVYLLQSIARILTFILDHMTEASETKVLAYEDEALVIQVEISKVEIPYDISDMFSPYHSSSFEKDERGLDMFIAYDLITRCMNGQVTAVLTEPKHLTLKIRI